jgi:hypothetical protein
MIRDPLGGWDWDGIRQLSAIIVMFAGLVTTFAALDSNYHWYSPWKRIGDIIGSYPEAFIVGAMIILLGVWWLDQYDRGYY